MSGAPRVHLANFDVEQQWARGEPGLPAPTTRAATAIVAAGAELALVLGAPGDTVVLKTAPAPELLAQLDAVGLGGAAVAVAERSEPDRPVTADALDSPGLLDRLRTLADSGATLAPHGFSADEARLCEDTGLTAPLADPSIAKRVNGKVFSRRLCAEAGIPQPPGWEVETIDELETIADEVRGRIDAGAVVGFKASYGVSGKGIMVCDTPRRFDQLLRLLVRRAEKSGDARMEAVLEAWQDKRTDLNYHFTIDANGSVAFDFVFEAVTENGTHRGHLLPDSGRPELRERLSALAVEVGARLAAAGYRGPVGIDAIVCADGTLYPVLEINARNNMSTYLGGVARRIAAAGSAGVAVQIDLSLPAPVPFPLLARTIGELALDRDWRSGFLVTCFASLNAASAFPNAQGRFRGRVHGVAVGPDPGAASDIDRLVRERLRGLESHAA